MSKMRIDEMKIFALAKPCATMLSKTAFSQNLAICPRTDFEKEKV